MSATFGAEIGPHESMTFHGTRLRRATQIPPADVLRQDGGPRIGKDHSMTFGGTKKRRETTPHAEISKRQDNYEVGPGGSMTIRGARR